MPSDEIGGTIPVNGLVRAWSTNGVTEQVAEIYRRPSRLVGTPLAAPPGSAGPSRTGEHIVPLRIAYSFDDLEGYPRGLFPLR